MSNLEGVVGVLELVALASGTCRWSPSPQGERGQETGAPVELKPRARRSFRNYLIGTSCATRRPGFWAKSATRRPGLGATRRPGFV